VAVGADEQAAEPLGGALGGEALHEREFLAELSDDVLGDVVVSREPFE
jgi:hypothetical protein